MPELPETETIARELDEALRGRVLSGCTVRRPDVLRIVSARELASRVRGATILRSWRRAKSVILDLSSGDRLAIQPRFTGTVLVGTSLPLDPRYVAVRFDLSDGGSFCYRDVRRLGTVALLGPDGFAALDARLGIEPLDAAFTTDELSAFLRSTRQVVKKVLMDQHLVAGVGNIYANEALWHAQLDPSREGRRVGGDAVARLRDAVVKVLTAAIEARGTTFRDYRDVSGRPGGFVRQLAVYGRGGYPCRRCGTRLVSTHAIDGRSTVFCFRCQD